MTIEHDKKQAIERAVARLVKNNTDAFQILAAALAGAFNGGANRHLAAKVFGFDPGSEESLETLILESLLNGLETEDIEDIVRRFARRRGLDF